MRLQRGPERVRDYEWQCAIPDVGMQAVPQCTPLRAIAGLQQSVGSSLAGNQMSRSEPWHETWTAPAGPVREGNRFWGLRPGSVAPNIDHSQTQWAADAGVAASSSYLCLRAAMAARFLEYRGPQCKPMQVLSEGRAQACLLAFDFRIGWDPMIGAPLGENP